MSWSSLTTMVRGMGGLEELHLSSNCLTDPQDVVFKVQVVLMTFSVNLLIKILRNMSFISDDLYLFNIFVPNLTHVSFFQHDSLRSLYLSCNPLSDFNLLTANVITHCPR